MSVSTVGNVSGETHRSTMECDLININADSAHHVMDAIRNKDDQDRYIIGIYIGSSNVSAEGYPVLEFSMSGYPNREDKTGKGFPSNDDTDTVWSWRNHIKGGTWTEDGGMSSAGTQVFQVDLTFGSTKGIKWDAGDNLYLHAASYASSADPPDEQFEVIVYWQYA